MKYIEIDIDLSESGIEPVTAELLQLGITNTVVEDPRDIDEILNKKEGYEWDYVNESLLNQEGQNPKIKIYLEDTEENRRSITAIKAALQNLKTAEQSGAFGAEMDFGTLTVTSRIDDDADWKDKWKEYFKPAKISQHIVVKPTWETYEKKPNDLVIEIDPGMAFGTGTHETTSMCVKLLEGYMKKGDCVLDVGCGSGILSIAAGLLGASDVLAVDIDPVAVEASAANIELNHLKSVARAAYGDLTKGVDYQADIIVANLMADLVMTLSEDVAKHLKDDGVFISSGILIEKEIQIVDHLRKQGFSILEVREEGEWCCIAASPAE